mmetsp:Transcript_34393/g.111927  ORF Transcript_34393/g.111927 Transcript_34393/m.111927 type:complete len:322 (+) Transcript_34393:990-1955(+)
MHAVVAEVLGHGAAGVRRKELQRGSIRGRRGHNGGVLQAVVLTQDFEELCHSGTLLADGNVEAIQVVLLIRRIIDGLLVEDRVDGNGSLACLTITDNELSLTTANRDQAVHSLQARGHGLVHALPRDDARRLELDTPPRLGQDGALAVNRHAEGIDHASEQLGADGHVHDGAGALNAVALHDGAIVSEHDDTDVVRLQVQRHALQAAGELNHLAGLHTLQPVDASDTIADAEHTADLLHILLVREVRNALGQDLRELGRADLRSQRRPRRMKVATCGRQHRRCGRASANRHRAGGEAREHCKWRSGQGDSGGRAKRVERAT